MKVLYLTTIPSPYYVDFFNELGKLCELKVIFDLPFASDRDKSWKVYDFRNFEGVILNGLRVRTDGALSLKVLKYLIKAGNYDNIVINNFSTPTGAIAILFLKVFKRNYFLETTGGFAKNGKGFKESLKKIVISNASNYLTTNKFGVNYFIKYGATEAKINIFKYSSMKRNEVLIKAPSIIEKLVNRDKLGLIGKKIALCVGQFIDRKNYYWLIQNWSIHFEEVHLYIIGDGPEYIKYLNFIEEFKVRNIHLINFKNKSELIKYYIAADVFLHPTKEDIWGLVINEAISCGLPIVVSERCGAGSVLVKENVNGHIVNTDINFFEKLNKLIYDDKTLKEFSLNSLKIAREYTTENMARDMLNIFSKSV